MKEKTTVIQPFEQFKGFTVFRRLFTFHRAFVVGFQTACSRFIEQAFQKEMTKILVDAEAEMQKNVTERWKADLEHGNWLTRSVRPLVLVFLIVSTVLMVFVDSGSVNFNVEQKWTDLLQLVLKELHN